MREHDLRVRVPRGDAVEQERPGEVDPQSLAAGLAGPERARPGVREDDQPELGGGVEERQEAVVAGIEVLQRGVELEPAQPELREPREPLQRVLAVRVDAAEARRTARPSQMRAISALSSSRPCASQPSSTPTRSSRS